MDYTVKVIDACRTFAQKITNDVLSKIPRAPDVNYTHSKHGHKHHYHEEHPNKFKFMSELGHYDITDKGIRCYCGSEQAYIDFNGLRMAKIKDETFDPAEKANERIQSITVVEWTNNSDEPEHHIFKHSKGSTEIKTDTTNIGLEQEITNSLKTTVGESIEIESAEIESFYQFRQDYTEQFGHEKTSETTEEDTVDSTYTVPPYTHTVLTKKKTITDWHQTVHTTGTLDAEIFICSEYPDFNPGRRDFFFTCKSIEELQEYIRGGGEDLYWFTDQFFKERHFVDYEIDTSMLDMKVVDNFDARDVQTSSIERNDTKLAPSGK